MPYDRQRAVLYAHTWAMRRNPAYANFDGMGGDCTNFISQCLFAGCPHMNHTAQGWYYYSLAKRTPAWSGVAFLYDFLLNNTGPGPRAAQRPLPHTRPGDVIQLSFDGGLWQHSLLVVDCDPLFPDPSNIRIATHTLDSDNRPLDSYTYAKARLLHVQGCGG